MKIKKKRTKKYCAYKIKDDHIPFFEHRTGLFAEFFNSIEDKINNFTFVDLINDIVMIYRFSFMYDILNPDECAQEIRDILDNYFIKHENNTDDNLMINISSQDKLLILEFLDVLKKQLFAIRSRSLYAKYMQDTIVNCNIYIGIKATWLKQWIDIQSMQQALHTCRKRAELENIIRNNKTGKYAYYAEDGSIQYRVDFLPALKGDDSYTKE